MKKRSGQILLQVFLFVFPLFAGAQKIQSTKNFFKDTTIIKVSVKTDIKNLQKNKSKPVFQPAAFTWHNADSSGDITENVKIKQRGNARKDQCLLAALMIDFSIKGTPSRLQNLGEIKWVAPCNFNRESEQWILKEFIVYKMYNAITDLSFRVRLIELTLIDEKNRLKPITNYAFAIEPADDLAKRLKFEEFKEAKIFTEQTNRAQTTLVNMFQFMIGNTDWSVPNYHNVKLFRAADSIQAAPYLIPYDFDYAGIVNTSYAVPYEGLPITSVQERYYLGFSRTMEEINLVLEIMQQKKDTLQKVIRDFGLLNKNHKGQMMDYMNEFFELIKSEKQVKYLFIDNVRKK
ncbi:MAG: hypothetical protein MUE99_00505 [Chitinophagaceae bacterium]|jgi:hypothetical protein|nr:hypothetical protein [Chitinophagaceae bacterium]